MKAFSFFLFLFLFLLSSCTKYASINKNAIRPRMDDVSMKVSNLKETTWAVGKRKEAVVTQSITFLLDMPKVKPRDLEEFIQLKYVDSWIVRLIVDRGSSRQDLGSLYTPFKKRTARGVMETGSATNVAIKIYYSAAYASERLRHSLCPALDHNKKITSMEIVGEDVPFSISLGQVTSYPEKSQLIELAPSSFNAGGSLKGEYFLEIAPYDSIKKNIHGDFKRIPYSVRVTEEKDIDIDSCAGERMDSR